MSRGPLLALTILAATMPDVSAAADLLMPPPPELRPTLPAEIGSGWYLRGDVGITNQRVDRLSNSLDALGTIEKVDLGFASSPFVGVGAGYRVNDWLRADVTGEYRSKASFLGLERYRDAALPGGYGTDEYTATKREAVFLANAYVDLGTYYGFTPFVGAGVGTAYNTIEHFKDVNTVTRAVAYASPGSKWNLAWALHAGVAYDILPNLKLEFGYRYLNLGDAQTGKIYTYDGQCAFPGCDNLKFKSVDSHDIKIGLRWALGASAAEAEVPPLVRRY